MVGGDRSLFGAGYRELRVDPVVAGHEGRAKAAGMDPGVLLGWWLSFLRMNDRRSDLGPVLS